MSTVIDWRAKHRESLAKDGVILDDEPAPKGLGVIDPRDQFREAPQYRPEYLPAIFEAYVADCVASWGGDPGPYACSFIAMHAGVLHSSVKMNTNPLKPNNWRNPNDFSLILGKSGESKSGMYKDLTRHQERWQQAMTRAIGNKVSKGHPPACFQQNVSIEGMMMQIHDNQGERLLLASEEAMSFYEGAAIHHKDNSAGAMSNAVCAVYDGGMYSKRLVNKSYSVPEALATLIMTTTFDKISGWRSFDAMVDSGLMARHTVSVIAHPRQRDGSKLVDGAEEAMGDMLLKMRGLRNMRFMLEPDAGERWLQYTAKREQANTDLLLEGASKGFVNWWRKYDMRIMSAATILQMYDYIGGGMIGATETVLPKTEADTGKDTGETKLLRTVGISYANLQRAVRFVEGYLAKMQEHFYKVAAGVTEFGPELMNFISFKVGYDEPDQPERRIIAREDLTHKGPACVRGPVTPDRKEQWKRWIQALLDHGFVEVYHHPRAKSPERNKYKQDNEQPHYKVRDEVFEYFHSDEDRNWLKAHFDKMRAATKPLSERGDRPVLDI